MGFAGIRIALIILSKMDTLNQHIRAEIESLFAAQIPEQTRTVAMENQYFYFLAIIILILLGFILYDRHQVNKTIMSFKNDLKELAKMKSDFSRLTALMQEIKNQRRVSRMPSIEVETPMKRFSETQAVVSVDELQRLQAYKRLYQEDVENLIEKKMDTEE